MRWSTQRPIWYASILALLLCLGVQGRTEAQGEAPRTIKRGIASPAVPGTPAPVPAKASQPLSPGARITLDQTGLSIDVQDQDLPAVVERIAALGQIALRHPEGMPNRRISLRFSSLPVVDGLKRLFRVAEVPGYVLVTARSGDNTQVQRIIFLADEGLGSASAGRGLQRAPQIAAAPPPPPPRPAGTPPAPGTGLPAGTVPVPMPAPGATPATEEGRVSGNVFDEIKSNAAARRLLSQMMHPNEQVRERAFEGLVRLVREDDKQRTLMEFLEPLMEDLGAEDQAVQDGAREEIRKLLTR